VSALDNSYKKAMTAAASNQKWAYHGTNEKTFKIIIGRGLVPQRHEAYRKPIIWFTDDSIGARFYGHIVLRFPFPSDGEFDDMVRGHGQFVTYKTIKPTSIEVWEEDGWLLLPES
jgi:hypothetical protein